MQYTAIKKNIIFILLTIALFSCNARQSSKPYEATWIELTETENGYVVLNHASMDEEGVFVGPNSLTVKGDTLIDRFYAEMPFITAFHEPQLNESDSSYLFPVGNYYRFMWADKENHIVRWITYHGNEPEMRVMFDRLYIDSLYNICPVVDEEVDWYAPME